MLYFFVFLVSCDCYVALVPWVCLQYVIEVFPDHIHLLFYISYEKSSMKNQALFSFLKKQHNLKILLGQIKNKCVSDNRSDFFR